jgi:hypothetical protein
MNYLHEFMRIYINQHGFRMNVLFPNIHNTNVLITVILYYNKYCVI